MGYKTTSFRISDEMQNARKEVVLSLWLADVDNGGTLEPVLVEAPEALACIGIQRVEGFVDHQPARLA